MIIRRVEQRDCKTLWQWRNHISTRQMSLNTNEVLYEEHKRWFASVLRNPAKLILMGELAESKAHKTIENAEKRVAMLRLDFSQSISCEHYDHALVSINVNPEYRGQSLGKPFLQQTLMWLQSNGHNLSIHISNRLHIVAQIKSDNVASIKLFESLNFVIDEHQSGNEILHYHLDLDIGS